MALLFVDGFNTYGSDDFGLRYGVSDTPLIDAVNMKSGVGCLHIEGSTDKITLAVSFVDDKFVIGFHFMFMDIPSQKVAFLALLGSTTQSLTLAVNTSGIIELSSYITLLGTAPVPMVAGQWYHFEFIGECSESTTQECILKVDGETVITVPTGTDTSHTAPIHSLRFFKDTLFLGEPRVDNLYVMDQSGPKNNASIGPDCIVEAVYPNGNGYISDFDGSDANKVDNYLLVDEASQDGDTTYIEDDDVGGIDTFTYAAMAGTAATIHGVVINTVVKKSDDNARSIQAVARPASTDYVGAARALGVDYTNHQSILEDNPEDDQAWTKADITGSEFGVKVES